MVAWPLGGRWRGACPRILTVAEARKVAAKNSVAEIPEGILPERPTTPSASSLASPDPANDVALVEYNRYLAELRDADAHTTDARPTPSSKGPQ